MLDLVNRDIGMSRLLSKALIVLTSSPGIDDGVKSQLKEILQGGGTVRDLMHNESFMRLGDSVIPNALADVEATSPEEQRRMAEAGEKLLETYRNDEVDTPGPNRNAPATTVAPTAPSDSVRPGVPAEPVVPGTRRPNRDLVIGPSDAEDQDDDYFRERNRGGWLR
ncbi:hypothetical protein [Nocardia noduli]|uniref:hypothetical protein n=1 Tax=Nocardia noduli TaxID=2815722 RepID=UPI001C237804|nr:hypothetical protein [Nocardia noduli]